MRLEVEGEEVGGQILPHFYCEDMMNVMNKVKIVRDYVDEKHEKTSVFWKR